MASKRWRGGAKKVAQVQSYTFGGTWEADDIVRLTVGSKIVDVTAGSTTTTTVVDNVVTAWNALSATDYPEFAEITASRSSSALLLTADNAGRPFVCTITPLESDGSAAGAQTIEGAGVATTGTASTANSSPNAWNVAANWDTGSVPVNSDDVYIDSTSVDIKYGLDQSAVTLTSLTIAASFTAGNDGDGTLGLPEINEDNSEPYQEYRDQYLKIGATTLTIGRGDGGGSSRIKINTGSVQTALTVYGSASSEEPGVPAVLWKGTHASNVVNAYGGDVGAAIFGGETATVATLRVAASPETSPPTVRLGAGVGVTSIFEDGGDLTVGASSGTTEITIRAGAMAIQSGGVSLLYINGGTVYYEGAGTLADVEIDEGGVLDLERNNQSRTITDLTMHYGATVNAKNNSTTFTNTVVFDHCKPFVEAALNLGDDVEIGVTIL